jgi:hypothetical protein
MFCPKCGAENDAGPAFCRRCGLSLRAIRLASEGRVDEALAGVNKGSGNITGGTLIIVIGLLNALINAYFAAWPAALICVLAGSGVGVPLVAAGMLRVRRARRLLDPDEEPKALDGAAPPVSLPEPAARESVTEHTTLKLDAPPAKETTPVNRR